MLTHATSPSVKYSISTCLKLNFLIFIVVLNNCFCISPMQLLKLHNVNSVSSSNVMLSLSLFNTNEIRNIGFRYKSYIS